MDSPPRSDEWMPLATQQLRLRHLIRIIGLNILCRDRCRLYFTLHHKSNFPAFYRSTNIQHCGNREAILWDHISCPEILKSNARAIWVRVWECSTSTKDEDIVLFTWRVWFSGLILTGSCSDAKYFNNTLIFQLNENCFSSPEHFSSFSLENNDYLYDNLHDYDQIKVHSTELRELPDSTEGISEQTKPKYMDLSTDFSGIRCAAVQRLRQSTRQSYNLEKLLRIQKMQRSCKRLKEDLKELTEQIINQNLRYKSGATKRRTIDYLLSDYDESNPRAKTECKELRKKIEELRFKCNLLEQERTLCFGRNQELTNQLRIKNDSRNLNCVTLQENYSRLADDKSILYQRIKVILTGVKTKKELEQKIHKRLSLLCSELKHIYPISKNLRGCFTVSNIPFPDKDYLSSNSLQTDHIKLMTPAALSVTLGFVAHLVQITAIILNKPLRFPHQSKPSIPSKQILYGIYLLNQNIAQLNYDIFETRLDPRATIENFLKLFCSIIKMGEDEVDSEISILENIGRIEETRSTRNVPMRMPLATEDKRYHSEDDLKTLSDRCLTHTYSNERLDKD